MPAPAPIAFHGCDYLALAREPRVLAAAAASLAEGELGVAASPATTGRRPVHGRLERAVAAFVGTEAALALPSGTVANLALLEALRPRFDTAWMDPRAHPSLRIARAAAGMRAAETVERGGLVLVDGVYPARGEAPDLAVLSSAVSADGMLLVDDAHGFGVRGPGGRGSVAAAGTIEAPVAIVAPFSKALGAGGAAVCGSAAVIDAVRASDAYVGSTALAPVLAAGAEAALGILVSEPERLARLQRHVDTLRASLASAGVALPEVSFPVFALRGGPERPAPALRAALLEAGIDVPLIRYPDGVSGGVSGAGYLRLALSAAHSDEDVEHLADTLQALLR